MFIRARIGYPGSFGFTWVHSCAHRGRRVHSCSLGYTQESPCSVVFAWIHLGAPRCRGVHSGLPGYKRARIGVNRDRLGSLSRAEMSLGSFGFAMVHSSATSRRRVPSG